MRVDMPFRNDVAVGCSPNVVRLWAHTAYLQRHALEMIEVQHFRSVMACWAFLALILPIWHWMIVIIYVLVIAISTIFALIGFVSKLTMTAASAWNILILWQFYRFSVILITNIGQFPKVLLSSFICPCITISIIECEITLKTWFFI